MVFADADVANGLGNSRTSVGSAGKGGSAQAHIETSAGVALKYDLEPGMFQTPTDCLHVQAASQQV